MARDLAALFRPAAIALIGASADRSQIRGRITHQLLECGYPGRIHLVHPRGGEIAGRPAHVSIADVPERIDLALVAIPATGVAAVLRDCAAAGVRAAYIFSSGFAEEGGEKQALQEHVQRVASETGLVVAGPNAVGFM